MNAFAIAPLLRRAAVAAVGAYLTALALAPPALAAGSTIELPGASVFPESVTATRDGTLYNGSFADGGVMRTPAGASKAEPFIAPGAYDSRSTFGVVADEPSGTLWVCSNDVSAIGVPGPSQVGGSALKGFDLKTGQGKISVPLPGAAALCNDIAVGPDGSAYVTDSLAPEILKLAPGAKSFEIWAKTPLFDPPAKGAGLDGIAFGADGDLYVDTFNKAELFRIAVKDGKAGAVTKLTPSRALVLADALHAAKDGQGFLLVEGGGRLDRLTVTGDQAKIETLADGLARPTGVAEVGGTAWVSEGQLAYLLKQKVGSPKLPFDLRAVPLAAH